MHRYFLIPVLSFFAFICIFVIYLQFINEDWKFLVPKEDLPLICNDESDVNLINHEKKSCCLRRWKLGHSSS